MTEPTNHCAVCGRRGNFAIEPDGAPRDNHACVDCGSVLWLRDLAQVIVDEFGEGEARDLKMLGGNPRVCEQLRVHQMGLPNTITAWLGEWAMYSSSVPLAGGQHTLTTDTHREDPVNMSFKDGSIDLLVSADVIEHVWDVPGHLAEVSRILSPGGVHVFATPTPYPLPQRTTVRAKRTGDKVSYAETPRHHDHGLGEPLLVVSDFGKDLVEQHRAAGLRLSIVRRSAPSVPEMFVATFVARRLN